MRRFSYGLWAKDRTDSSSTCQPTSSTNSSKTGWALMDPQSQIWSSKESKLTTWCHPLQTDSPGTSKMVLSHHSKWGWEVVWIKASLLRRSWLECAPTLAWKSPTKREPSWTKKSIQVCSKDWNSQKIKRGSGKFHHQIRQATNFQPPNRMATTKATHSSIKWSRTCRWTATQWWLTRTKSGSSSSWSEETWFRTSLTRRPTSSPIRIKLVSRLN